MPDRQGGDGGGVDAAAEEDADRDVGHEAAGHGGVEQAQELGGGLARVDAGAGVREGELPVAAHAKTLLVEHGHVRGGELADAGEDAPGSGDVLRGEVLDDGLGVDGAGDGAVGDDGLELGAEDQAGEAESGAARAPGTA